MITSLFKNNPLSYLIIILMSAAIWFWNYSQVDVMEDFRIIFGGEVLALNGKNWMIISFFITIIPAWLLNFKLKQLIFSYEPTNMFLFFYILIVSLGLGTYETMVYTGVISCLIIIVGYLITFREKESNVNQIFNSAFIIGILMFHNLFFAILLLVLILNLNNFKRISINEIFVILIGFSLPYLLVLAFSELTDNYQFLSSIFVLKWITPTISLGEGAFLLFLVMLGVFGYRIVIKKRTGIDVTVIRLTKNLFSLYIGSIALTAVSLFIEAYEFSFFIMAISLSVFLSDYFANSKFKWKELLFLFVVFLFGYQLF